MLVLFFGVDEVSVDETLIELAERHATPAKCMVFGTNFERLGGLVATWEPRIELAVVYLSGFGAEFLEVIPDILSREGIDASQTILVHRLGPHVLLPRGICGVRIQDGWTGREVAPSLIAAESARCARVQKPSGREAGG